MAEMASKKSAAAGIRSGRGFLLMLVAMAGLALLLRLGVWAELGAVNGGRNSLYTPSVFTDLATYMKLGREIAAGEYSGPFYYQPFYYAVFLPVCYWLSAGSIGFVIFVQSLLGAGTSWFAGLAAARLFGRLRASGYPAWMKRDLIPPLTALGKHSLIVYLVHQPLLIVLFDLLTG